MKSLSRWWCGYNGEKYVLIDEMRPKLVDYLDTYLKIWADPWKAIRGEIKGGSRMLQYEYLMVTSNYSIE